MRDEIVRTAEEIKAEMRALEKHESRWPHLVAGSLWSLEWCLGGPAVSDTCRETARAGRKRLKRGDIRKGDSQGVAH